jgi:hypothetical protein
MNSSKTNEAKPKTEYRAMTRPEFNKIYKPTLPLPPTFKYPPPEVPPQKQIANTRRTANSFSVGSFINILSAILFIIFGISIIVYSEGGLLMIFFAIISFFIAMTIIMGRNNP